MQYLFFPGNVIHTSLRYSCSLACIARQKERAFALLSNQLVMFCSHEDGLSEPVLTRLVFMQNEELVLLVKASVCLHQQAGRTLGEINRMLIEG